ncbi:VvgS protein [Vibrio galatheae]|uniref:VvgS protein n=1 Tax=Vibrio galatheae TaxID=579748 RepID=A0A0F4NHZ3_9VIBR|nr:DUF2057 family protein [Vibrio galatheae]KJY81691.1 VvgS protein [Vibrio galatheae]
MKVIKTLFVVGAMVASFAPRAEVNIDFHSDISPLLVGGDIVGYSFFDKSVYTMDDGKGQIVFRISKLVDKLGEKEKFNSKAYVVTFDETNQELFIEPDVKITRLEQAEAFEVEPSFSIKNKQGQSIKFILDELPSLGGISRDYEKELAKYNKKHYPELAVASATIATASESEPVQQKQKEQSLGNNEPNMFEYWVKQASNSEVEQFADIALEGRKMSALTIPNDASQPVQMLGYWFNKASVEEKKKILAYLISL